jgi:hypothetical protein
MIIADYYVIAFTWLAGAVVLLGVLCFLVVVACIALRHWAAEAQKQTLMLMRLSTARYWVKRMEKEGLTVCRKDYRRLVAERKPQSVADFERAEQDDHKAQTKGGAA